MTAPPIDPSLLAGTKGFLHDDEGLRLYEVALEASRLGPCLEIGSYCGKSTLYLGAACRDRGGILFSIDHHRGSDEQQPGQAYCDPELIDADSGRVDTFPWFRGTLEAAGLEDTVVPVVSPSVVVARCWATPLSLVFIDGGHTAEAAAADYLAWSGHLMTGGYLLIHDVFFDPDKGGQAPRQIYERARSCGRFEDLGVVNTLGILKRDSNP
ncbi:MAG: class I SAM-dependent methyltransferase [Desulfobacterales bacterium]|jgi:predicted O-methyltransferase YrrM